LKKQIKCFFLFVFLSILIVTVTGCSSPNIADGSYVNSNSNVSENSDIDVDLTVLSETMFHSMIQDMLAYPDEYAGKTIKARGEYFVIEYIENDQYFHFIELEDEDGCCSESFEFIYNGDRVFPDDYPPENTIIEIIGVFNSYEMFETTFYYLAVDDLKY